MARRMLGLAASAALGTFAGSAVPHLFPGAGDDISFPALTSTTPTPVAPANPITPPPGVLSVIAPGDNSISSGNSSSSLPPPVAGPGGPQKGDTDASSSREEGWDGENRCCLGLLYHSQRLHDRQRGPVCLGVRSKPNTVQEDMRNPLPGLVDFKYMCIGYSVYDIGGKKHVSKTRSTTPTNLPYCEGLEIISSRDVQESPVLLKEGLGGEVVDRGQQSHPGSSEKEGQFPQTGRNFVKGADVNVEDFPSRLAKVAKKILQKMIDNLKYMAKTIYQMFQGGSSGGKPKDN